MGSWRDSVARPPSVASLGSLDAYVKTVVGPVGAPIDSFYGSLMSILAAATPSFLNSYPITGPLFLGGIVASTEEFMRALFGRIIAICPDSQAHAAEKPINLGSAVWHGQGVIARGAFESMSLSGKQNVLKTVKNFLGYQIIPTDNVWGVLDEYDKVSEIRHGVVHSGVTLPGKNAVRLKLTPIAGTPRLQVGFSELQNCADVCTALAVSLNVDLFRVIAERWATTWRRHASWGSRSEHQHFKNIWEIFHSSFDDQRSLIANPISVIKCRNAINKEFS